MKKKKININKRLGSAAFDRAIMNKRRLRLRKIKEEESEARGIMGETDYFD